MTKDELLAFLDELTDTERRTFNDMRTALNQPVKNLDWYFAFGKAVSRLRGTTPRYGLMKRMAEALDCKPGLLNKTRFFARRLYGHGGQGAGARGKPFLKPNLVRKDWVDLSSASYHVVIWV